MSEPSRRVFDPRGVPARPVVDVRFDVDDEGHERAVVDGLPIRRAPHETARESAIRTVADLVDRIASVDDTGRRSAAVRARVHAPRGGTQTLVVHRDRRVFVPAGGPAEPTGPATPGPTHRLPAESSTGAATTPPGTTSRGPAQPAAAMRARTGRTVPAAPWGNRWPGTTAVAVNAPLRTRGPVGRRAAPTAPAHLRVAADGQAVTVPAQPGPTPTAGAEGTGPAGLRHVATEPGVAASPSTALTEKQAAAAPQPPQPQDLTQVSLAPDPADVLLRAVRRQDRSPSGGTDTPLTNPSTGSDRATRAPRSARSAAGATAIPAPSGATARPGAGGRHWSDADAGAARRLPAWAAVVAAALVVLVAGAGVVWTARRPAPDPSVAEASAALSAGRLPTAAPVGWMREARWVTPALLPAAGPVVALDDAVAFVGADRRLVVVDAMTGRRRWNVDLPAGQVRRAPARTELGGTPVLAMHVGDTLLAWAATDGHAVASVTLPPRAQVTFLGSAPLVGLRPDTVGVVRDGRLVEVRVPGGATPLAATTAGTVTAASPAGWWHMRPDVAPALATPWETAQGTVAAPRPRVVGYLASSIVTVEPADRTGRSHVVVHTDRSADVRLSFRAALAPGSATRWTTSPSQPWGVLGRTLVDVRAGSVLDLGSWTTTWVADDRAYGTIAGAHVVAGPDLPRGTLPKATPPVETSSRQGGAVRVAQGSSQRVYFLPPAQ